MAIAVLTIHMVVFLLQLCMYEFGVQSLHDNYSVYVILIGVAHKIVGMHGTKVSMKLRAHTYALSGTCV